MKALTYLVYILAYEALCLGGCAYLVWWKGISPWWWILGSLCSSSVIKPSAWAALYAPAAGEKQGGKG